VICVINNDAITLFELDEAEAYYLYETKEVAPIGEARTALRDRLIQRIIENRLQLQQAEREKIAVEDTEIAEQMADIMKRMNAKSEAELEQALRQQGVTAESVKKRIRDQIMVDRIRRRRVNLRSPSPSRRSTATSRRTARSSRRGSPSRRATSSSFPTPTGARTAGRTRSAAPPTPTIACWAAPISGSSPRRCRRTAPARTAAPWARSSAAELASDIEAAILRLSTGETSAPFRSQVGYHLFRLDSKEALSGDGLTQARNQIRDILLREKLAVRLRDWLAEIRQRAIIDMRL
jgi:peptidyl-prolyl cis-trans isomerase SurA